MTLSKVQISPVLTKADWSAFMRLPWRIYGNDPHWVPPLMFDLKRRLETDPARNPFFEHARAKFWLARRNGEVIGRISAHVDDDYNAFQGGHTGWFGWFECENDREAAFALLDTAREWLQAQGMGQMLGPGCYGTNDPDLGFLVEGRDCPPMLLNGHTAPHYHELAEAWGMEKAMDLYCYRLDTTVETPPQVKEYADWVVKNEKITIRNYDPKHHRRDLGLFHEIYNAAWEKNWGFVPLREKEFHHHAGDLRHFVWPDFVFFAEIDGKPAGAALTLPNLYEVQINLNGRLLPFGLIRMLRGVRRVKSVRVFALGVKKEFRESGLGAVFYHKTLEAGKRHGIRWGEMSWILENNKAMNKAIRAMGGEVYKTYRLYARPL